MTAPQTRETRLAGRVIAKETTNTDAPIFADTERFATLAAKFALAGHALIRGGEVGDCPYYACKWGFVKPLADLADAEAFLRKIGGAV